MKELMRKFKEYRNIYRAFYIFFYFVYVAFNMYLNRWNYVINIILLISTLAYFFIYIYSAFIDKNKKLKNRSHKTFVRTRKTLLFINACILIASLIINHVNSFFTIVFAVGAFFWYALYIFADIASTLSLRSFRKYTKGVGWKQ